MLPCCVRDHIAQRSLDATVLRPKDKRRGDLTPANCRSPLPEWNRRKIQSSVVIGRRFFTPSFRRVLQVFGVRPDSRGKDKLPGLPRGGSECMPSEELRAEAARDRNGTNVQGLQARRAAKVAQLFCYLPTNRRFFRHEVAEDVARHSVAEESLGCAACVGFVRRNPTCSETRVRKSRLQNLRVQIQPTTPSSPKRGLTFILTFGATYSPCSLPTVCYASPPDHSGFEVFP